MAELHVTLDRTSYNPGDEVVATLTVVGAESEVRTVTGHATVDGVVMDATASFVLSHQVGEFTVDGFTVDPVDPAVFRGVAG